ncbi:MAG: hypothetical protein ACOCR8_00185 [Desulfosalsimonas sp.]
MAKNLANTKHTKEINFIRNYFEHNNWVYEPARFNLGDRSYVPDFYDCERGVFIEVVGSRQAYEQAKEKYSLFVAMFPLIKLELRFTDGSLLKKDENSGRITWNGNDRPIQEIK